MYADTTEWGEGTLHGIVMSDYVAAEVMDGVVPELPRDHDEVLVGYGDRPSRAWLRTSRQFVLIKSRDAALSPAAFALARAAVAEAERLAPEVAGPRDRLLVRGLELRGPGRATLHLDLICAAGSARPYLSLRAVQECLERHDWRLGDAGVALTCKAQVVASDAEIVDALDDRYYERVRLALGW